LTITIHAQFNTVIHSDSLVIKNLYVITLRDANQIELRDANKPRYKNKEQKFRSVKSKRVMYYEQIILKRLAHLPAVQFLFSESATGNKFKEKFCDNDFSESKYVVYKHVINVRKKVVKKIKLVNQNLSQYSHIYIYSLAFKTIITATLKYFKCLGNISCDIGFKAEPIILKTDTQDTALNIWLLLKRDFTKLFTTRFLTKVNKKGHNASIYLTRKSSYAHLLVILRTISFYVHVTYLVYALSSHSMTQSKNPLMSHAYIFSALSHSNKNA
jgi:hypothetical protein